MASNLCSHRDSESSSYSNSEIYSDSESINMCDVCFNDICGCTPNNIYHFNYECNHCYSCYDCSNNFCLSCGIWCNNCSLKLCDECIIFDNFCYICYVSNLKKKIYCKKCCNHNSFILRNFFNIFSNKYIPIDIVNLIIKFVSR
jgi:hypothetical protein